MVIQNKSTKIIYFPDYTSNNPYQNLLYSASSEKFYCQPGTINDAYNDLKAKEQPIVFHLHWVDPIYSNASDVAGFKHACGNFMRLLKKFCSHGGYFVWTIHNALPHDRRFDETLLCLFHAELADLADIIHTHSKEALPEIRKYYPVSSGKVKVIPHGSYKDVYPNIVSRDEARKALSVEDGQTVFTFVGQLRPYKGLENLIDAFVRARKIRNDIALIIAGKPVHPMRPLQWTATGKLVDGMIVREGYIPDDQLQVYLNAADCAVFPYTDILTSGSIALAASFGVPVVVPDLYAISSLRHHEFVTVYNTQDVSALSQSLVKFAELNQASVKRQRESAQLYAEDHAWNKISPLYFAAIDNLISEGALIKIETPSGIRDIKVRKPSDDISRGSIAVAIVDYFSLDDTKRIIDSLPNTICDLPVISLVLDNSADEIYNKKVRRRLLESFVVTPDDNVGFAAGYNLLFALMKQMSVKYVLMLNPDTEIERGTISKLLSYTKNNPEVLVSPLIMRDETRISFAGTRITKDPCLTIEHIADGSIASITDEEPYEVDSLNGCAMFFDLSLLETISYIPENFFLYYEETVWCVNAREKGVKCIVVPDARVTHRKVSQKNSVPTIYYTYYLVRNSYIANRIFGGSLTHAENKLKSEFIDVWRGRIRERMPDYSALFDNAVSAAQRDFREGKSGKVDLIEALSIGDATETTRLRLEHEIVYADPTYIIGWARCSQSETPPVPSRVSLLLDGVLIAVSERVPSDLLKRHQISKDFAFLLKIPAKFRERKRIVCGVFETETGRLLQNVCIVPQRFSDCENHSSIKNSYKGRIEGIKQARLRGWVANLSHLEESVLLDIEVAGLPIRGVIANVYRPDLEEAGIGDGCHGFDLSVPNIALRSSSVDVAVRVAGEDMPLFSRNLVLDIIADDFDPCISLNTFLKWSYISEPMRFGAWDLAFELQKQFNVARKGWRKISADARAQPLVSVIMPVYNRENIAERAIKSVCDQHYTNWELIIVDDGSSDQSVDKIQHLLERLDDDRIKFYGLPQNEGVSAARNVGLDRAAGEIICYLDSDNVWYPECLSVFVDAFETHAAYDCAYAGQEIWEWLPHLQRDELRFVRAVPFNHSRLERKNFIDLNVFAHRKSCVIRLGGFEERMTRLVDWEFIYRLTLDKPPIFIPLLLNKYYFSSSENQITRVENYQRNKMIFESKRLNKK